MAAGRRKQEPSCRLRHLVRADSSHSLCPALALVLTWSTNGKKCVIERKRKNEREREREREKEKERKGNSVKIPIVRKPLRMIHLGSLHRINNALTKQPCRHHCTNTQQTGSRSSCSFCLGKGQLNAAHTPAKCKRSQNLRRERFINRTMRLPLWNPIA